MRAQDRDRQVRAAALRGAGGNPETAAARLLLQAREARRMANRACDGVTALARRRRAERLERIAVQLGRGASRAA